MDQLISTAQSHEDLVEAKRLILSHIFTLRKENRHLLRRLDGTNGNVQKYTEARKHQLANLQAKTQLNLLNAGMHNQS